MSLLRLAVPLMLAAPALAQAQVLESLPLRHAEVTFAMKATTVPDFVGRVDTVQAAFSGAALNAVTGHVEFRVRDMHTGIGLRDTHMRNAMKADSFPTVRFDLTTVEPGAVTGDSTTVELVGTLTIHGVSRPIRAPGAVVMRAGQVGVFTAFPLDMRDYGIVPPTRFLGAVKVNPMVGISVKLLFAN